MPADRVLQTEAIVQAIAFTTDGALAGACGDRNVRVWDVATGKVKLTVPVAEGDRLGDLPAASDVLATIGKDGQLKTWNLQTGKPGVRLPGSTPRTSDLAVSPDRRFLVSTERAAGNSSDEIVHIWETTDARERVQVPGGIGGTATMAISPDSSIVVASSYDANVRAWNSKNGELLTLIEQLPVTMFAMAFSPDGKTLATGGADRVVYLWDTKTWKLKTKFTGQREMISALAYSPNGKYLLTGGFNAITVKHPVDVILRDASSGKVLRTVPGAHRVGSVAFSPDGRLAAFVDGQKSISLLNIA